MTEFKNVYENKLKTLDVVVSDKLKQKVLRVTEESLFAGSTPIIHEIILWSKDFETREESPDVIKATEEQLQSQFGNQIVFGGMNPDLNNPNEFEVFLKNQPEPITIPLVTVTNKGNLVLGEGAQLSNEFGDSVYLKRNKQPGLGYNPETERVSTYEALSQEEKNAVMTGEGASVRAGRGGILNFTYEGLVKDVIFVYSNNYNDKENVVEYTRESLKEKLITSLKLVPEFKEVIDDLDKLPSDYAFSDIIDILGGYKCTRLSKLSPSNPMTPGIEDLLEKSARVTMKLVLTHPTTGYNFYSSGTKLKQRENAFGLQFEFLYGDFSPSDLNRLFLTLTTLGISQQESLACINELGYFDAETSTFKYETPTDALQVLRALFGKRRVRLSSMLRKDAKSPLIDPSYLGGKVEFLGPKEELQVMMQETETLTQGQNLTQTPPQGQNFTQTVTNDAPLFQNEAPKTEQPQVEQQVTQTVFETQTVNDPFDTNTPFAEDLTEGANPWGN